VKEGAKDAEASKSALCIVDGAFALWPVHFSIKWPRSLKLGFIRLPEVAPLITQAMTFPQRRRHVVVLPAPVLGEDTVKYTAGAICWCLNKTQSPITTYWVQSHDVPMKTKTCREAKPVKSASLR
jgi:hypothetical protein